MNEWMNEWMNVCQRLFSFSAKFFRDSREKETQKMTMSTLKLNGFHRSDTQAIQWNRRPYGVSDRGTHYVQAKRRPPLF